jgi:hypothetical protein
MTDQDDYDDAALHAQQLNEQQQRESDMSAINEIAGALAKAQAEMSNPAFDAQNPHFKNRYASLAAVRNSVVPVLAKHGIACLQDIRAVEGGIACETLLMHASGQQMRFGPLILPVSKADAQGFGSAATYARRYQLMAVAGVVGDADDDAEAAVGRDAKANGAPITAEQLKRLQAAADEVGADLKRFCAYLKVHSLVELPASRYTEAVAALEAKRGQKEAA